jgi:hypothetical protein
VSDPIATIPPILQTLNLPVQRFALAYLEAFPGSSIVSGRRGIDSQAAADAADVVQSRAFIANVYAPSAVRDAMVAVCDANPAADAATLGPLFASCLGSFSDGDLSHFSLHLSGNAVDCAPVGDPARETWAKNWVSEWIAAGGSPRSRVLTEEDGEVRLHVQLV